MADAGKSRSEGTCWRVRVCTLFPEMFPGPLGQSLAGKALDKGIWSLELIDIRDHGIGRHRVVDDTPFGGGPGMVMRPDVMDAAITTAMTGLDQGTPKLYFSPRGKKLDQHMAQQLAASPDVVMIAGRYEGLDQRVIDDAGLTEVSIGDYVLSGGELPALVAIDAVVRLLPGVMGNADAHEDDSFSAGLLEHPLYTQPREWKGHEVPSVLTSGNHKAIADWRLRQAKSVTRIRRPDMWQAWQNDEDKK